MMPPQMVTEMATVIAVMAEMEAATVPLAMAEMEAAGAMEVVAAVAVQCSPKKHSKMWLFSHIFLVDQ
jgi:hypothetical protein